MKIEEYIKHFDKVFNTDISKDFKYKKFSILELVFNELAEYLYELNDESKDLAKQKNEIYNKLKTAKDEEFNIIIDELTELNSAARDDLDRQLIIFGYCICYQQMKEMNIIK